MRYKRNEPFRYQFEKPIYCILQTNQEKIDGSILDLSPNGMKVTSTKDLPLFRTIHITFGLNGNQFKITGNVRWKKSCLASCVGGIQLQNDQSAAKAITRELKEYVKKFPKSASM
ncbi:PilZ domain-containing protein [Niallia oryzisoli]|uniref:PilZ domain-containing protein n=1 Tax=Niallia oryzisoli TaxID=1737571 RepID=A0ABZ2CF49_9BACI